jgi:hypothetical protein
MRTILTYFPSKEIRKKQSSGMWHRVDVVLTDVSEERIASIFRVEGKTRKSASEETVRTVARPREQRLYRTTSELGREPTI